MFSKSAAFFCLVAAVGVLVDLDLSEACDRERMTSCPHVNLVTNTEVIPVIKPDHMEEICSKMQQALNCLTGPAVLGSCSSTNDDGALKDTFVTMNKVVHYTCVTVKKEYLDGRKCWSSSSVSSAISRCYGRSKRDIKGNNYCRGIKTFGDCAADEFRKIEGCRTTERTILDAMVAITRNGMANTRNCDKLPVPSFTTTTNSTMDVTSDARGAGTRHEAVVTVYVIAAVVSMIFSGNIHFC